MLILLRTPSIWIRVLGSVFKAVPKAPCGYRASLPGLAETPSQIFGCLSSGTSAQTGRSIQLATSPLGAGITSTLARPTKPNAGSRPTFVYWIWNAGVEAVKIGTVGVTDWS